MAFQLKSRFAASLFKSPLVSLATHKNFKRSLVSRFLKKDSKMSPSISGAPAPFPAPTLPPVIDTTHDSAPSSTEDISLTSTTSASAPESATISSIDDTTLVAPISPARPSPSSKPKSSGKVLIFRVRPQGKHVMQLDECVARLKDERILRLERELEETREQVAAKDEHLAKREKRIASCERDIAGLVKALDRQDSMNRQLSAEIEQFKVREMRSEQILAELKTKLVKANEEAVKAEAEAAEAKAEAAKWKEEVAKAMEEEAKAKEDTKKAKAETVQMEEELAQAKEEVIMADAWIDAMAGLNDQLEMSERKWRDEIKRLKNSIESLKERVEESERKKKESDESLEAQKARAERAERVLEKYWGEKESSVGATKKKRVTFELEPESQVSAA